MSLTVLPNSQTNSDNLSFIQLVIDHRAQGEAHYRQRGRVTRSVVVTIGERFDTFRVLDEKFGLAP